MVAAHQALQNQAPRGLTSHPAIPAALHPCCCRGSMLPLRTSPGIACSSPADVRHALLSPASLFAVALDGYCNSSSMPRAHCRTHQSATKSGHWLECMTATFRCAWAVLPRTEELRIVSARPLAQQCVDGSLASVLSVARHAHCLALGHDLTPTLPAIRDRFAIRLATVRQPTSRAAKTFATAWLPTVATRSHSEALQLVNFSREARASSLSPNSPAMS